MGNKSRGNLQFYGDDKLKMMRYMQFIMENDIIRGWIFTPCLPDTDYCEMRSRHLRQTKFSTTGRIKIAVGDTD